MNTSLKRLAQAAGVFTAAIAARGNVTIAEFDDIGEFSYAVEHMTDLDQKRAGLPKSGKAYCVPASGMNLITYAANFGFPELFPGPGLWEGVEGHDDMTDSIALMGLLMGTDPDSGTGLFGQDNALEAWLGASDLGAMSVVTIARGQNSWPTIDTGAFMGTAGAIVNFAYGRYDFSPGFQGVPFLENRAQGHSVTLQRAVADNGSYFGAREVGFRNPSRPDDEDLNSNAIHATSHMETASNIDVSADLNGDGTIEYYNVTSLINPTPATDRLRIIDSVTGLYPPGGMSYSQVQVSAQFAGGGLGFVGNQAPSTYGIEPGAQFVSVIPHPELHSGLAIVRTRTGSSLVQLPHGGKRSIALLNLPADSKFLVPGPRHESFVITSTGIAVVETAFREGVRIGTSPFSTLLRTVPIEAGAYDSARNELLLISGTASRLFVLDASSFVLKATHTLPTPPLPSAVRSMSVSGREPGRAFVAFSNGQVGDIRLGTTRARSGNVPSINLGLLRLKGVRDPISVDVDGGGRLYVADSENGLLEFIEQPGKGWVPAPHPYYAGTQTPGRKFSVFRSRNNLERGVHDRRDWLNDIDEFEQSEE
ncbi:MAG: hypothetical protein AB7O66_03980 [Limisphaerales bacterium]